MSEPLYWRNEVGGELRLAVEAYLIGLPLAEQDIRLLRAYFRQWIVADVWDQAPLEGRDRLDELRRRVDSIKDRQTIDDWLKAVTDYGIDPL